MSQAPLPGRDDAALHQLEQMIGHARGRLRWTRIVLTVVFLCVAAYLSFAYRQIATVDADMVGQVVQSRLRVSLPQGRTAIAGKLIEDAPVLVDQIERAAMKMPQHLRRSLVSAAHEHMKQELCTLADELVPVLEVQLEVLAAQYAHVPREERGPAILDRLAQAFRDEAIRAVDAGYEHYQPKLSVMTDELQALARGDDLSERQRRQRELIQATMAMLKTWKHREDAFGSPVTRETLPSPAAAVSHRP
jgi:hypothetical protein